MGFFSSKCSKSKISIPAGNTGSPPEASTVVVVKPDNTTHIGIYDGYGRVEGEGGTLDVCDMMMDNTLKWVRKDHYKGETYAQLQPAEHCEFQGYFYDQEEIDLIEMSLRHNSKDFITEDT